MSPIEAQVPHNSSDGGLGFIQRLEERVSSSPLSQGVLSEPVLGLPLLRVIPQDVHSVLDYSGAVAGFAAALISDTPSATVATAVLGSAGLGVSLLTDYKLSLAKVIPSEVHEAIDHVWGFSNIVAPFLFGYFRKEPVASAIQIGAGLATVLGSLFTDYRASEGVTWSNEDADREASAGLC